MEHYRLNKGMGTTLPNRAAIITRRYQKRVLICEIVCFKDTTCLLSLAGSGIKTEVFLSCLKS